MLSVILKQLILLTSKIQCTSVVLVTIMWACKNINSSVLLSSVVGRWDTSLKMCDESLLFPIYFHLCS
jgi:hypothetical protein